MACNVNMELLIKSRLWEKYIHEQTEKKFRAASVLLAYRCMKPQNNFYICAGANEEKKSTKPQGKNFRT